MSQNIWVTEPHQTQAAGYCRTDTHAFIYTMGLATVCLNSDTPPRIYMNQQTGLGANKKKLFKLDLSSIANFKIFK